MNSPPDGTSWATAFTNVNNALSVAASGDEVWVAKGSYTNHLTLEPGIALYGGFLGNETNLAQRNWSLNKTTLTATRAMSVVSIRDGAHDTRIDGFTIMGCKGNGIICYSAIIANNRIVANLDSGIYCSCAEQLLITNNVIAGNGPRSTIDDTVGGGINLLEATATVENNVIAGNNALGGGGIDCWWGNVLITGNTIVGNESTVDGGGMDCGPGSHRIIGNRFINNIVRHSIGRGGNFGGGGLFIFSGASPMVANNLFVNNASFGLTTNNCKDGGGIRCEAGSSATLLNNTLVGNRTDLDGGAISLEGTNQFSVMNNVVAGNSSGIAATTNTVFSHNCVHGNGTNDYDGVADPTGTSGNIASDPKLTIDSDFGTAHLLPDSPCRDAGDSSLVQADWTDADGQPRIVGAAVDIGAHESDGLTSAFPPNVVRVSSEGDDANNGSNWTLAKRNIQAAIDTVRLRGGEAWVREGTYPATILLDTLAHLYGGFAGDETNRMQRNPSRHETILDAQRGDTVVTCRGAISWGGVLDGFTIQNGLAAQGGGIFIDRCSPRVAHNRIRQNQAQNGGGIMIRGNASPVIIGNWIVSNLVTRMPDAIGNQYSHGGGVYQVTDDIQRPYSVLINNLIADNRAEGGLTNPATGGGIFYCGGSFALINNTFLRNVSIQTISNIPSSFADNVEYVGCRATATHPSGLIENNIFYFGCMGDTSVNENPFVIANNCFFANGTNDYLGPPELIEINGNFVADPLLVETNGLPILQAGSPCIDAGDDSVIDPTEPDLAGNPRLMGSHVDIGAIEFDPSVILLSAPQWTAGTGLRFKLSGPQEKEFVIQTSTDFQNWKPVMTNHCGTILITNPPSGRMDQRYFRAVVR